MSAVTSQPDPVRTLAAHYYTDPVIFQWEMERIFYRSWQFVGHSAQLAEPGDYLGFQVGGQSLVAVHGSDGQIRAFYNVCQHRGHELLQGSGHTRLITCPYHAWVYELDGRLRRARNSQCVAGFDPANIRLSQVRLEHFCGFLFANLNPEALSMAETFPGIEAEIRDFAGDMDSLQAVHDFSVEETANWKIAVENYNECYHCQTTHPTFARGVVDPGSYRISARGQCLQHRAHAPASEWAAYRYDNKASQHAHDYSSWFLWPSFSLQVYPGGVVNSYHWHPLQVEQTRVTRGWYARDGKLTPELETIIELDRTTTFAEDLVLMASVQRGMNSRGYRPGPLIVDPDESILSEHPVLALQQLVLQALAD